MKYFFFKQWGLALLGLVCSVSLTAQVTLTFDVGRRGPAISSTHYGIFFEEINHAGDGGLYAELIHNRSFEDNTSNPDKWWPVGDGVMALISDGLLNAVQGHALKLTMSKAGDGVRNEGFWGINVLAGQTYRLSFWIKAETAFVGNLKAELQTKDGASLGSKDIQVDVKDKWIKMTAEITATEGSPVGWFALTGDRAGTICLDVVSLMPPTYKNRENGCRPDLAGMLEAMKPSFVRFPGGCYVEGHGTVENTNRFEWKKTIGPIEERPGHWNRNWGYRVSDGLGFHEMLQLTEDLGAEPLFVVNMGMGHGWVVDYNNIGEYIQEALDAIEYCNGDAETTYWGGQRAKNGHPEPFNLRLLEIGNENYNFSSENNSDQSDHYAERYEQFRKAIREKYPDMVLIGNVESWGTDNPTWRNPYPVDVVDEHYYRSPSWFVGQYNKYDTYSRSAHKVYAGEYAVTQGYGVNGHLTAALGEAVYMLGMENNSDVCIMNSYAPIFVNENNYNWRPDMIRFNSYTSYGTPSYHVQQLMPTNVGKVNIKWEEENNSSLKTGRLGLSTWSTSATFDNVKVTSSDGTVVFNDDFRGQKPEWSADGGTWSVAGGVLNQTDRNMQGELYNCNVNPGTDYTFEVEATKTGGAEGFLIAFNVADANNYCWWNLGGWNNSQHGVEVCSEGSKSTVASVSGSLTRGHTYRIKIEVKGTHVKCYLDDVLMHDFTLPVMRKVYVSSNIDDESGVLYVKLVNPSSRAQTVNVNLNHASTTGGSVVVLSSPNGTDENNLENPDYVSPKEHALNVSGNRFVYEVDAYSLNILRLNVTDVEIQPEENPVLPEPIVQYSFEQGNAADDAALYQGELHGGAGIVTMNDGNKALYTGSVGNAGWLDLGVTMAGTTLAGLDADYTISIDMALSGIGNLTNYCWAYAFANGEDQYIGMVNKANHTDWYYTVKNETTFKAHSNGALAYNQWHNLTFVQEGTTARWFVDGYKVDEETLEMLPADIAGVITEAYIGRSPFASDALLCEAFFDNFRIFGQALTEGQIRKLYAGAKGMDASSEQVAHQADIEALNVLAKKFNYLHATTLLPKTIGTETAVKWTLTTEMPEFVSLNDNKLVVLKLPQGNETVKVGELKATLQLETGEMQLAYPVYLAPDDNRFGYLYCFMNPNHEITNYALGTKEDKGSVFHQLLEGGEIFDTDVLAGIEGGTRDAYIDRGQDGDGFFITTTDMKQAVSGVWNNHGLNLMRSKDLIHWESSTFDFNKGKSVFSDPEADTGMYTTDEQYAKINRVWAPQFIWDKDYNGGEGAYLVYYSLLSSNDGDNRDRIFYSYTDREFKTLTQPRIFFDPGISVIDADIVYNPYDGLYHMYYKREGANGNERGIYEATSDKLVGGTWTDIMHVTNEGTAQVEGSSTVRRINEDVYNLYYMRYSDGYNYKYCETDHLGLNVTSSANLKGEGSFQHGSIMTVTEEEYNMLQAWSDMRNLYSTVEDMYIAGDMDADLGNALDVAKAAEAKTTIAELSVSLPAAIETLKEAMGTYQDKQLSGLKPGDEITYLLKNPDFNTDGDGSGWSGTSFTAVNSGVAEFYDKTFDISQVLQKMPAGTYRLQCHGFYRYGDISTAYSAHGNGNEKLLANLYLNEARQPFMSLYDESAPYAFEPYGYPDGVGGANTAFNTDGNYTGNQVECTLNRKKDLTVGLVKEKSQSRDWNCFDNFRLYYVAYPSVELSTPDEWATLILPFDAEIPEGLEVYSCDAADKDNVLELVSVSGIEANVPYIVKGDAAFSHTFTGFSLENPTTLNAGMLTGIFDKEKVAAGNYVLQSQNGKVGFYRVMDGEESTIGPNRAYIALDGASATIEMFYLEGDGITEVKSIADVGEDEVVTVYNLNGVEVRRGVKMSEAAHGLPKGIYVTDTQKKIVVE